MEEIVQKLQKNVMSDDQYKSNNYIYLTSKKSDMALCFEPITGIPWYLWSPCSEILDDGFDPVYGRLLTYFIRIGIKSFVLNKKCTSVRLN